MYREIQISIYLFFFKMFFNLFNKHPLGNKITFIVSFYDNATYIYNEMIKQNIAFEITILCKLTTVDGIKKACPNARIIPFENHNIFNWLKGIYYLSTSKTIIIDNYYAFLSAMKFKPEVNCIQVWHAVGALKTFGFNDKSIKKRSKRAHKRFRDVYDNFNTIVVGSENMARIFRDSFQLPEETILRSGIPRTDFLYDSISKEETKMQLLSKYPQLRGKKVILYAPTFREWKLNDYVLQLDINKLYEKLKDEFVLIIKLHQVVNSKISYMDLYPDFVIDISSFQSVNDILIITDFLITDYSSIPFEYAPLQKPMIFFPYDLEEYKEKRGLLQNYESFVPGPIANSTDEISQLILNHQFELNKIREFSNSWNEYSDGNSAEKLIKYIISKSTSDVEGCSDNNDEIIKKSL